MTAHLGAFFPGTKAMPTNAAREPLFKMLTRTEVVLPFATSLAIAGPCSFLSIALMHKYSAFPQPMLWVTGVLALAGLNIATACILDGDRARLGAFTMPALLAMAGIVLMYIFAQSINRYVTPVGYDWMLPFVIAGLGLCYCGVFLEKSLFLKASMAASGLALTVMWCLGSADKLALPF